MYYYWHRDTNNTFEKDTPFQDFCVLSLTYIRHVDKYYDTTTILDFYLCYIAPVYLA